jgi:hypothetical protein
MPIDVRPNFFACTNEGTIKTLVGNETTDCQDDGGNPLDVDCTASGNDVTCTFLQDGTMTPEPAFLLEGLNACSVEFDVQIQSLSGMNGDLTPNEIEQAGFAPAVCDNGFTAPASARAGSRWSPARSSSTSASRWTPTTTGASTTRSASARTTTSRARPRWASST